MEKSEFKEVTKLETVLPRTMVPKQGRQWDTSLDKPFEVTNILGGPDEDVLCAMFLDPDEAQAWIIASCHFGQPVKGYKLTPNPGEGVIDAARIPSGEQPTEAG